MKLMTGSTRALLLLLVALWSSRHAVYAFQPIMPRSIDSMFQPERVTSSQGTLNPGQTTVVQRSGAESPSSLFLFGKNAMTDKNKKKEEITTGTVKQDWDFGLFLVYMTPWKNPNSIFVYLFLTLYLLGEYSEAHRSVPPPTGL